MSLSNTEITVVETPVHRLQRTTIAYINRARACMWHVGLWALCVYMRHTREYVTVAVIAWMCGYGAYSLVHDVCTLLHI